MWRAETLVSKVILQTYRSSISADSLGLSQDEFDMMIQESIQLEEERRNRNTHKKALIIGETKKELHERHERYLANPEMEKFSGYLDPEEWDIYTMITGDPPNIDSILTLDFKGYYDTGYNSFMSKITDTINYYVGRHAATPKDFESAILHKTGYLSESPDFNRIRDEYLKNLNMLKNAKHNVIHSKDTDDFYMDAFHTKTWEYLLANLEEECLDLIFYDFFGDETYPEIGSVEYAERIQLGEELPQKSHYEIWVELVLKPMFLLLKHNGRLIIPKRYFRNRHPACMYLDNRPIRFQEWFNKTVGKELNKNITLTLIQTADDVIPPIHSSKEYSREIMGPDGVSGFPFLCFTVDKLLKK